MKKMSAVCALRERRSWEVGLAHQVSSSISQGGVHVIGHLIVVVEIVVVVDKLTSLY